jgi:hypothetical protein
MTIEEERNHLREQVAQRDERIQQLEAALDIPWLFKFIKEDRLSIKVRDEIYRILRYMIPQFGIIENVNY